MAMHAYKSAPATKQTDADVADDMSPFLRRYKDGRIERLMVSSFVPPSEAPGATGVATRDVVIDPVTGVSVRLFLSLGAVATGKRLPLIVYFHGGGFCTGSAFSNVFHRYATSLSACAGALVVSVEYRLAPEHPIPAAYDDAWAALRWVASMADPWLADHADRRRMFLAGESAGGNIVHNMALRCAAHECDEIDLDVEGIILLHPYFWGSERLPSETDRHDGPMLAPEFVDTLWPFLTAGAAGNDDPRINPPADQVKSLPCRRALVAVAAKDVFRDRGRRYASWLRHGERCGEVTLVESEGEDHVFHLHRLVRAAAMALMDRVVRFVDGWAAPAAGAKETELLRQCRTTHLDEWQDNMAWNAKLTSASIGLELGRASTSAKLVQKGPFARAARERTVAKSCL